MAVQDPNWAEVVLAIATSVGVIGLLATIVVAAFAGRQAAEARHARQTQLAADFLRRWDEDALVETRRLVAQFKTKEELRDALQRYIRTNAPEEFVLYRELDYFEQLGALERLGAFNFDLIVLLLGDRLIDRWELWKPSIDAMAKTSGTQPYPMFESLVGRMRAALGRPERHAGASSGEGVLS
jgi:hypothetical protein